MSVDYMRVCAKKNIYCVSHRVKSKSQGTEFIRDTYVIFIILKRYSKDLSFSGRYKLSFKVAHNFKENSNKLLFILSKKRMFYKNNVTLNAYN